MTPLLEVTDLRVEFRSDGGTRVVRAVDGASFSLGGGESLALLGESGCGKSTTCMAIMGLLPPGARITGGSVRLDGQELVGRSEAELRKLRGRGMAMILQDPMASLNPLLTIYRQVAEPAYYHHRVKGRALRARVKELLAEVSIPSPEQRMKQYPHEMSGGMRQRVVGAAALAGRPNLIIADEPTTNLDVSIQAEYLKLLERIQDETGVALLFVTHDLGIVAAVCDSVAVMYAGKIVERTTVEALWERPRHPYSRALLRSLPRVGQKTRLDSIPGSPPDMAHVPPGCPFHPRCPEAFDRCTSEEPPDFVLEDGTRSKCWLAEGHA